MIIPQANRIFELFDQFIENSILKDNSLITGEENMINLPSIQEVMDNYVLNQIPGKGSFEEKIERQFGNVSYEAKVVMAHAIWLWCMSPNDFRHWSKKELSTFIIKDKAPTIIDDVFHDGGFGSAGPYLKYNKPNEIIFCVLVLKLLKQRVADNVVTNISEAKDWIEKYCLKARFNEDHEGFEFSEQEIQNLPEGALAMYNIFFYLSKPREYERIASESHKNKLYNTFKNLLHDAPEEIKQSNRDSRIFHLREIISQASGNNNFDFYDWEYLKIWNYGLGESSFDEFQALQYKKAVILYGPPGTSKTHSAKQLAQTLIYQHYFKSPENVKTYLVDKPDILKDRVHRLQLHPNYSYEDFVAGIQIKEGKTEPVKGYFLNLIEEIENDDFPHVLILDEINRVDLSRVFGELFSGLENREETIVLSLGKFTLKVPQNLYVIGTMNEIDFSLERLDFALRRRFVWFFYGFNRDALSQIIELKSDELGVKIKDTDKEKFINSAIRVNQLIRDNEELGKAYEIGHTFFGEIVNVYHSFKEIQERSRQFNLYLKDGPAQVLWEISIKPMINAFLGNLDNNTKKEVVETIFKAYIN